MPNINTVIADLKQALADAEALVKSVAVPPPTVIPQAGLFTDPQTGILWYNGKIVFGWINGTYYIDGKKGSPFKTINNVLEYDSGSGFKPFSGWAGSPSVQYVNGVPLKNTSTSSPTPVSTASSNEIPLQNTYLDPKTGLMWFDYNGKMILANIWINGKQYSDGHLVTDFAPVGFYNLPPRVPGSMTHSGSLAYCAIPPSLKVMRDMVSGLPQFFTLPMHPLSDNYINKNSVWDGKTVSVSGVKNGTVSFQLLLTSTSTSSLSTTVSINGLPVKPNLFLEWFSDSTWGQNGGVYGEPPYTGYLPEALIPFEDEGNQIVTSLILAQGQITAVWIDIPVAKLDTAGTFSGNIEIISGASTIQIPLSLTILDVTLPDFNSDPSHIKAWGELYTNRFVIGNNLVWPLDQTGIDLYQAYQIFLNSYCMDTQLEEIWPTTTYDTATDTTVLDWTLYDLAQGPANSGTLFPSGQPQRAVIAPIGEEWSVGSFNWNYKQGPPPPKMMNILTSYIQGIVSHWNTNGWKSDTFAYLWDEPQGKDGSWNIYSTIVEYAKAVNSGNDFKGSVCRMFLTAAPEPLPLDFPSDSGVSATSHLELVTPKTGENSWVLDWAPGGVIAYPGPGTKNPDLSLSGVKKLSSAPVPIRTWFYQGMPPFTGEMQQNCEGQDMALYPLLAYKYGIDGCFVWSIDFWGGYNTQPTPSNPVNSPYKTTSDGLMIFPGNLLPTVGFKAIKGPIPTNKLAMWRQGYQTYLLLWMLEQKDPTQAQALFDTLITSGLNMNGWTPNYTNPNYNNAGLWSHNPDDYETVRIKCADLLMV